jgi:hypothetical protein
MSDQRATSRARTRRSRAVKAYFARPRFPRWTVWFTVLVIALMAWQAEAASYLLGAMALVAPGWTVRRWCARPGDRQFDAWMAEGRDKVLLRSVEKIGLDRSNLLNQVYLERPEIGDVAGAYRGLAPGRDGYLRYTPVHFTVFNFTAHKLAIYQCAFDLTTGRELDERVDEWFYTDIVSHTVESGVVTLHHKEIRRRLRGHRERRRLLKGLQPRMVDGQVQIKTGETLILSISSGDKMRVALLDPQFADEVEGRSLPIGKAEESVALIRKMIDEQKHAA